MAVFLIIVGGEVYGGDLRIPALTLPMPGGKIDINITVGFLISMIEPVTKITH